MTELGTVTSFKAKQHVCSVAVPKFQKARPVPFAVKDAIDNEFNWLEACGIVVSHSEWAAPTVVDPKKDGKFRVCGDYIMTINQALDINVYPLPKIDDHNGRRKNIL